MRPAGWCDEPAGFFLSVGRPSRKDRTCPATASATFIPRASRPRSLRPLLPQVHIARWSWASRPQHRKTRRRPAGPQVQHPRRTPRCRSRRCAGLAGTFHGSLWLPSSSGHPPCQRVVAVVLRDGVGTRHEDVGHIPRLEIAVGGTELGQPYSALVPSSAKGDILVLVTEWVESSKPRRKPLPIWRSCSLPVKRMSSNLPESSA
jgi:hypothetical protein